MYRIGLFSKINKVTVKTLRYYDETGLLKPALVDRENGYRYYTSEQLPLLHKILAMRQMGFSIDEITAIMKGDNIADIFEGRKHELEQTIEVSKQQLAQITHYLEIYKEEFSMDYEVALKELPEVIVYYKRTVIPDYDYYFKLAPELAEELKKTNPEIRCAVPGYCFVIYHDGEYRERDIDIEFCEAVTTFGKDTETIKFKKVEKVPIAACAYHQGPYSSIGKAYAHLFKWIADNDYVPAGYPRESYIDGIWNKESESEWLTELQIPVVKR